MPKKNTIRESRRVQRAARRRKQQLVAGAIFGVAILAIAFLAYQSFSNQGDNAAETTGNEITTASGLMYEDLVAGTGPAAQAGDVVSVHYTGTLTNGEKFDSSLDRGTPFQFELGAGRVIRGWDEGVAGMQIGGKRKLIIPPELGYGAQGAGASIPPNSTLIFEVELLDIVGEPQNQ
jgi:FKBP-type peptidyl-prolyl cis-trans isomerase